MRFGSLSTIVVPSIVVRFLVIFDWYQEGFSLWRAAVSDSMIRRGFSEEQSGFWGFMLSDLTLQRVVVLILFGFGMVMLRKCRNCFFFVFFWMTQC